MVNYIIQLTLMRESNNLSPYDEKLLADIPTDLRTDPQFLHIPSMCSYREFSDGPACRTQLLKLHHVNGSTIHISIKHFIAFSFKDWLVGILSCLGIETLMDKAWEKCNNQSPSGEMIDIFEGEIIQNFQGPDGKHFGLAQEEG